MSGFIRCVAATLVLLTAACRPGEETAEVRQEGDAGQVHQDASLPSVPSGFLIENSIVLPIRSTKLGRDYEIYIKTPPSYGRSESSGRRYPVIYLTDGPYTFQVASGLSRLPFSQERFHEFIIVGISWAKGDAPADSRRRDLTPWRASTINGETGGAPAFWAFLRDEAMPLVEQRYRVDSGQRTLVGQSYGGLFGLWVALTEPGHFKNYVLTSPSIWFADHQILRAAASSAALKQDLDARIYLATGAREHPGPGGCAGCENDMVADQERLANALRAHGSRNLQLRAEVIEDAYHETTFPIGLMKGMQWLYLR